MGQDTRGKLDVGPVKSKEEARANVRMAGPSYEKGVERTMV